MQLTRARRAGFCVPDSLVGNDAAAIRHRFPGPVVVKSVDTAVMRDQDDSLFAYTWLGDSSELSNASVSGAPVIAQRAFTDKVDWRVTVVGDCLAAVKVLADGRGALGDWRKTPRKSLTYIDAPLPPHVSAACFRLVRTMGLAFGAIDLVEDQDGFHFIEINPTGEWGWLSGPDRPIGDWIVDWLANPPATPRSGNEDRVEGGYGIGAAP